MKKQFLVACSFIFAFTTGILQANSNPTMSRVYGNQYTPQVADTQSAGAVGTLDTTFDGDGSLSINGALAGGQAVGIQALQNGSFLAVVAKSGSASVVAQYNAEGALANTATYGTSGIASLGTSGATVTPRATMLDMQGRLVVAGGADTGTAGWIARLSADGDTLTTFTTGTAWSFVGGIAQQSSGKIIAVGFNGSQAQIARYTLAGVLDTSFGYSTGYIIFDGGHGLSSAASTGLYSVVVDSSDNIYVLYLDGTAAKVAKFDAEGALDVTFDGSAAGNGIVPVSYLDTATASTMRIAIDSVNDLVVGANVAITVKVASITSATGVAGTVANFTTAIFDTLSAIVPTSDGKILLVGSDTVTPFNMAVMRLTSVGVLDTATFNPTSGYNLFNIGTPDTAAVLNAAAIAPDGQIYTAGYQINSATTTPYVSRLYNTQYVAAVPQYPLAVEQGILDQTFGTPARETYAGVTSPFNGLYGSSMMQRATAAVESRVAPVPAGDIIVGMNGFLNGSSNQNMMFAFLNQEGAVDTTGGAGSTAIPTSGYLTLQNLTTGAGNANEYMTSMLQDGNGIVYVSGYASSSTSPGAASATKSFIRAYSGFTAGTAAFNRSIDATTVQPNLSAGTQFQGVGLGYQGFTDSAENRSLLCTSYVGSTEQRGVISAYTNAGALDTTFGNYVSGTSGIQTGTIAYNSYGLHMGPCYGLVVAKATAEAFIYAAYVDSASPTNVNVAKFQENGNGLIPGFGTAGVLTNIFGGVTINPSNVRMGLLANDKLCVAAITTSNLYVVVIDPTLAGTSSAVLIQPITGAVTLDALSRVTGVSDNTAMITLNGTDAGGDHVMYLVRLNSLAGTLAPALDTTFNSQGAQPGVQPIQIGDQVASYNARTASYALIQSTPATGNQGNIAVIGYESVTANDATPMAMRSYGTLTTTEVLDFPISTVEPGTFDFATNLFSEVGIGWGNVIFTYPTSNANANYLLVGIDNGTTSKIARVLATDLSLDNTFGSGTGIYTISPSLRGISHISIDAQNNILVGGTNGSGSGAGWAQLINNAGTSATLFNMPASVVAVNNILQQQSGRYIVAGQQITSNKGVVVAFQDKLVNSSTFEVDPTFNPLSYGSAPYAGSFLLGNTDGLYAMAIQTANNTSPACQLDMIAVAYNVSGIAQVATIAADGNGFVFGPTATTLSTDSSATVQLNIDASQNIVVATSYNTGGHRVFVCRYDCAGGTTTAFDGAGVSAGVITLPFTGSSSVTLTGIMETSTQQTVLTGYNTPSGSPIANGSLFAARLVANGALDTIWNTSPVGSDYAGLLTYSSGTTPTQLNVNSASIALNGNVYSIGSSSATVGLSNSIVSVVYGNTLVTQVSQNPLEVAAGIIDTTIPGGASGASSSLFTSNVNGVPAKIYVYNTTVNSSPNGAILVASTSSNVLYVTQLNADFNQNSHFGSGSAQVILTPNSGTSPSSVTVTDMYIANGANDTAQPIYVAGYTTAGGTNTPFAVRIASDGSSSTYATPASSLTSSGAVAAAGCIRQSTNGRVLVSGYNGTAGAIVAYNSEMTAIDTSFGNHSATSPNYGTGYYATATNAPIVAMTTDNTDRLYIAYRLDATTINIDRVLENGTALDTSWGTAGTVTLSGTSLSASQIKLAIDLTNNQLIVAAQDGTGIGNIIQLARFNLAAGAAAGTLSTITQAGAAGVLSLSDLFIDNDAAAAYPFTSGAYPNIYVIGYAANGHSIVARVATTSTTMALDTSYATTGIANLNTGGMTTVAAGMLDPDRRVYLIGGSGYVARVFGDYYWTQASPAIMQAQVGSPDLTLAPGYPGTAGVDLSQTAITSAVWNAVFADNSYTAYAVIENPNNDGSVYVAFGNGTSVIVGQMNADLEPVTGFGTNGLTIAENMTTVGSIAIDASGNIIVAGTHTGAQTVYSYTSAGVLNATFATPTVASVVGTVVAQQKSGRYIVGGQISGSFGLVSAYKNQSAVSGLTLPVDATFGAAALNGYYATAVASQIDDLVIDSNDYIYIVYRNTGGAINVAKLTPEGCLSNSFNTPSGQLWTANPMTASSSPAISITATQPARIAINSAGNILVGASVSGGITTQLINGSTGALIGSALAQTLGSSAVLKKLVGAGATSAPGAGTEFYGTFYNSVPAAYVFAVTNAGILDPAFNSGAVLPLTGQTPIVMNGLSVQTDGKLVAVGANNAGAGSTRQPILMRAYGYEYVAQFAQDPDQIGAGQLDTTLWPTTGAMVLSNLILSSARTAATAFNTLIAGYAIKRVYEYGNGVMLFVADSGANTVIFQLKKDLSLDESFGTTSGTPTPGYINLLTNYGGTTGLFVDSLGNIYVTGNKTGAAWAKGFTSAGVALSTPFAVTGSAILGTQIAQQSNGRIIISGSVTGSGKLYGYNNAGVLDPSFGTAGGVSVVGGFAITDIAIDAFDNIIAVSNNSGTVGLFKISASGLTVDNIGSNGTAITGAIGSIKVVLDNNGNIVVAAATTTGYALRSYLNNNSYPTSGSASGTNIGSASFTAGTTPVLANIYATNDTPTGKITLVGYDSAISGGTAYDAIAARFVSASGSLALDTSTFNVALTGAGTPQAGVLIASLGGSGSMNQVFDGIIHADDRIMLVGSNLASAAPYMGRVFGDKYVSYISQAGLSQGVAGTLNPTFGDTTPPTGAYSINILNSLLVGAQGKAMLPLADGGFFMAFDNANTAANSILIKTLANGTLDTSYNPGATTIPGIAGSATSPHYAPLGVNGILQDGSNNVVLVGTTSGAGWVQRYTSAGVLDTVFNGTGIINLAATTSANAVVEQTLARLVVAGSNSTGAALFAYESLAPNGTPGSVDTTFNAGAGGTPGYVQIGSTNAIYNLVADQYDRLIFAVLNTAGNAVDLYRLTPTGELDNTFGTSGKVASAIATATGASSVRVTIDLAGHIIVAANSSTANTFSVRAFNNGTSTGSGSNGAAIYAQLNISSLTHSPSVTSLIASTDGYSLVGGNQSTTNAAWIARITAGGSLDTTGFNPAAVLPGVLGIFGYQGTGSTAHVYNALAICADGTIGMLGYENSSGVFSPTLVSVYDDPYTTQEPVSPDSKAVGSVDLTLGLGAYTNGIIYYGSGSLASYNQVGKAVALYDDNNMVVAIDGENASNPLNSSIFINMFDTDGLLNPAFGTAGQATVLQGSPTTTSPNFQNQYVSDMITYTDAANVRKAIVAGFTYNTGLPAANSVGSLLFQYTLTPGSSGLDTSFGGFNGSPQGIAFGDGKLASVVGQQSTGRIIVGGLSQNDLGLLLGYTANGKLDMSFGNDGYQSSNTGSTGIFSHAIDTQNRIAITYNSSGSVVVVRFLADGSAPDSSFNASASYLTTATNSRDMKVAVDSSDNVYVAAVTLQSTVPNQISLIKYSAVNGNRVGSIVNIPYGSIGGLITANYVIGRLIVDTAGNVIIVAYDIVANNVIVIRLNSSLALDSTFNGSGTGYVKYAVNNGTASQVAKHAMVHPDGRIIIVGSEA